MATRMQQRKGTAAQWISTNNGDGPILNAGEIGYESDTNKFKIGDGVNHWVDLNYFSDEVALGGNIDDYVPLTQKGAANGVATLNSSGVIPSEQIPSLVGLDTEITTAVNNAINALVDGAPAALDTLNELSAALNDNENFASEVVDVINTKQDAVDGVTDTQIGYLSNVTSDIQGQIDAKPDNEDIAEFAIDALAGALTEGTDIVITHDDVADTITIAAGTNLATVTDLADSVSNHNNETTLVHGIDDTAELATKTFAANLLVNATKTNIQITGDKDGITIVAENGVADSTTDNLAEGTTNKYFTDERAQDAIGTNVGTGLSYNDTTGAISVNETTVQYRVADVSDTEIGYLNGVTSAIQTQIDAKAPSANPEFTTGDAGTRYVPDYSGPQGVSPATGTGSSVTYGLSGDYTGYQTGYLNNNPSGWNDIPNNMSAYVGKIMVISGGEHASLVGEWPIMEAAIGPVNQGSPTMFGLGGGFTWPLGSGGSSNNGATVYVKSASTLKTISDTELGYLDGVTSAIQTQIDSKSPIASPTFTGTVTTDDLVVEGDLTVTGTTTTINATDLAITDPLIYLASEQYTEDVLDVGFLAATGAPGGTEESHLHSGFFRDASDSKKWKLVSNVPHPVGNVVDITNATKETLVVGAFEATSATFSGTVSGITKSMVGLGDVDNTTDANKPVSTATQTALDLKSNALVTIDAETESYTLILANQDQMVEMNVGSANTLTVPTNSSVAFPIGTRIHVVQTGSGQTTITPAGGVTVNGTPGLKTRAQWSAVTLVKRATDTWVAFGDLTA